MLRRDHVDEEVDEELSHHLAMRYADNLAAGMDDAGAWEDALRRFGNVERVRHATEEIDREALREERRMEFVSSVVRATKLATRTLLRDPWFAMLAVLTLGLGIGSTAAIYTLIDSIVLKPLPYANADRLVQLQHPVPKIGADQRWGSSEAGYFYYVDNNRSFEELGGFRQASYALTDGSAADRISAIQATASLFRVLGAEAAYGRLLTDDDNRPGAPNVAVLGYDEWQLRYGGRRDIVGTSIRLDGEPHTVVGVLARGFDLPESSAEFYVNVHIDRGNTPQNYHWMTVYGRLRPDISLVAANADLERMASTFTRTLPTAYTQSFLDASGFRPELTTLRSEVLGGTEKTLWILLSAVGLVFLIACANVANLFLVRTEARRREIAVRSALGAEGSHLAVHFFAETLLLALVAGIVALIIAHSGVRLLIAIAPVNVPRLDEIVIGWRVVAFVTCAALLAGTIFGMFPLVRRRDSYASLREGGRGLTASRGQHFARNTLVAGQMALALVLLIAGALLLQSYRNLRSVDIGIDPTNVITAQISIPRLTYDDHAKVRQFYAQLSRRVAALPGVMSVGTTASLPLAGGTWCSGTEVEAAAGATRRGACVPVIQVSPGYFETMGIDVQGELFQWSQLDRREGVAIISRALAAQLFPDENPIGRHIISYRNGPPWYRIIGIADDVHAAGVDKAPIDPVYYPITPMDIPGAWMEMTDQVLVVRTAASPTDRFVAALRAAVAELDPNVPVADIQTMTEVIGKSEAVARSSFTLLLLAAAAGLALFLSAVGLYGVISYIVAQRRNEIGVRIALGARADQVRRLIVKQSLVVIAAGAIVGLPIAFTGTRMLRSLLFGVSPTDAATFVGVTLILLLVGTAASWLPALRAARVQPMHVLREE